MSLKIINGVEREDKENPGDKKEESKKKFIKRGRLIKVKIKEEKRTGYQEFKPRGDKIGKRKTKGKISFKI